MSTLFVHRTFTLDAEVRFGYDANLVDLLKTVVPPRSRKWHASTKTWAVGGRYVDRFVAAARLAGHQVIDDGAGRQQKTRTASAGTPRDDWATALFAAVGPAHHERVFKALVKVLHPDAGGDTELMQTLNRAHDELGRRAA
jgi:hypothetical protein